MSEAKRMNENEQTLRGLSDTIKKYLKIKEDTRYKKTNICTVKSESRDEKAPQRFERLKNFPHLRDEMGILYLYI